MTREDERCTLCKRLRSVHEAATYATLCHVCKLMFKHADKEHCLFCNQPERMMYNRYLNYDYFDTDQDLFSDPTYETFKICYECAHYKLGLEIPAPV
jgi:hypothetical protein